LSSDYAVVGSDSRIGSLYAKVGLTPDLTVSALLADAVGERRALRLVLDDRMLTADEALDWGLVAEVVDPDRVLARAEEVARGWLSGGGGRLRAGEASRALAPHPHPAGAARRGGPHDRRRPRRRRGPLPRHRLLTPHPATAFCVSVRVRER